MAGQERRNTRGVLHAARARDARDGRGADARARSLDSTSSRLVRPARSRGDRRRVTDFQRAPHPCATRDASPPRPGVRFRRVPRPRPRTHRDLPLHARRPAPEAGRCDVPCSRAPSSAWTSTPRRCGYASCGSGCPSSSRARRATRRTWRRCRTSTATSAWGRARWRRRPTRVASSGRQAIARLRTRYARAVGVRKRTLARALDRAERAAARRGARRDASPPSPRCGAT